MLKLIQDRISVICALVIGTSGGWGMTAIITAPELKPRLVAISIAVSLILSLLISVSLKNKLNGNSAYRKQAVRKLVLLLFGFIFSAGAFFIAYDKYTIPVPVLSAPSTIDTVIIVKGLYFTASAKKYSDKLFQKNHELPSDELILNDYGFDVSKVWDDKARSYARMLLLLLYTALIGLLVAGVSFGAEFLQQDNRPKETAANAIDQTLLPTGEAHG